MPTTTKMGIVYPASTDLVKDGATNMGTIATTVDAKTGMVLLNTTSFSATSSTIVPNVFSANYKSYKVFIELSQSAASDILFRLRTGATSATTNYAYQYLRGGGGTTVATAGASGQSSFLSTANAASGAAWSEMVLHRPFEATDTFFSSTWFASVYSTGITSGLHATATSYESFEILPTSGNFTGTVKTYGLNQ